MQAEGWQRRNSGQRRARREHGMDAIAIEIDRDRERERERETITDYDNTLRIPCARMANCGLDVCAPHR